MTNTHTHTQEEERTPQASGVAEGMSQNLPDNPLWATRDYMHVPSLPWA